MEWNNNKNINIFLLLFTKMEIIIDENAQRILQKEDGTYVNVGNGMFVQYTGIHYASESSKTALESDPYWYQNPFLPEDITAIERKFIGKVITYRANFEKIQGIYVLPIYIWDEELQEWNKIANIKKPDSQKYFYYPHLQMIPGETYYHLPLYFLHTFENVDLHSIEHITKPFYL
jgi:hypothetical protein